MEVIALCPSRGRPDKARECLASFEATKRDPKTRLVFVVDSDDPAKDEYPGEVYVVPPGGSYVPALNRAAKDKALVRDATAIGFIGDDVSFRTPGWDVTLGTWLTENAGIAWGDDGWDHPWKKEEKASHWWVSRPIVDVFGLAPAGLRHFYPDDFWAQLGWAAGCARYFPDVLIEHIHPMAGKADTDGTYNRPRRFVAADKAWWSRWQRRGKAEDVQRLKRILATERSGPRRVLVDWHHPALYESLAILFEDRFGWELYSPTGMEWAAKGIWRFTHEAWKAEDYLCTDAALVGDHYETVQPEYPERKRKLLTLDQANRMKPEIVIATVAAHDSTFGKLARSYGARYVYQMGNARQPISRLADLIIASTAVQRRSRIIRYHQEFDSTLFAPAPIKDGAVVSSFMLRLDSASCGHEWLAKAPGIEWHDWGGIDQRAKTYLSPMSKVAAAMRKSGWIWHDKKIGDGYGHVIHNAAAMGRPLIGHGSHYKRMLGEPYWRDLETCIDLDRHSPSVALRLIKAISRDPEWHADMANNIRKVFAQRVDFDAEAAQIRAALA